MASTPDQKSNWLEYVAAGWWNGQNSSRSAWLLPDTQFRSGVNITNRGGIPQTRPGKRLRLTLPAGNLQGVKIFRPTKDDATVDGYQLTFAVDGKVYAAPFPLVQPPSWEPFRLKNIQFSPSAKNIYWCITEKTLASNDTGQLSIVPTYSVLMMQDGITDAAYWDGLTNAHLDENKRQTPIGTWMAWAGNRLWVARGSSVIAGDLDDPLSFIERTEGPSAGDFGFDDEVQGLTSVPGDNRQTNLLAFTNRSTGSILASQTDRDSWVTTPSFQTILYENLGCVAGRSIVSHAGLIWWYAAGGLVSSNSVAASFLTSEIKFKDTEMVNSKRNLAPDLSGVCCASFENYLLVSVPSGDILNAHTWALDYAQSTDQLQQQEPPAWQGHWTGTRPVEWATEIIDGRKRIFEASIDYQSLSDGSFNHIWENFDPSRMDSYVLTDASNAQFLVQNKIFCSFETKLFGDGMEFKRMKYAEADLVEMGGEVNLRVSFCGNRGSYKEIFRKTMNATIEAGGIDNEDVQLLGDRLKKFHVQSRRITTQDAAGLFVDEKGDPICDDSVESEFLPDQDKSHGLLFEWCGRMGIEALRMYHEFVPSKMVGECPEDEETINIVTNDGVSFQFPKSGTAPLVGVPVPSSEDVFGAFSDFAWVCPITPRFKDVFYSSLPVSWSDLEGECVVCLPCARDTFSPPDRLPIIIQDKKVL